jgi:hypothetical protein
MTPTSDVFRVGLLALLTGIAVPLLVQLFLVLRDVRRTTAILDQRLDRTLTDLGDVVAELKRVSVPASSLAGQLAAAAPAVVAAVSAGVRAFHTGVARENGALSIHHPKEDVT